jgi:hypothetical protein
VPTSPRKQLGGRKPLTTFSAADAWFGEEAFSYKTTLIYDVIVMIAT